MVSSVSSRENNIQNNTGLTLSGSGVGMWTYAIAGDYRSCCAEWFKLRGLEPPSDLQCHNEVWWQSIHQADRIGVKQSLDALHSGKVPRLNERYRILIASGQWQWILTRAEATHWTPQAEPTHFAGVDIIEREVQGNSLRKMGSDTDVTAIKVAEQRFERMSGTLDLAMQAAGMGVWEWQLDAEGSYWDARTCKVFGIVGEGRFVPSADFMSMVHPDDLDSLEQELRLATDSRRPIAVDYRINHPKLGVRYIKTHAECHTVADVPGRYVGIVWDVTDTYQRENELADAKNLLDDVIEHMDQGLVLFRGEHYLTAQVVLVNRRFFNILELPEHLRSPDADFHTYMRYLESNGYLSKDRNINVDQFMHRLQELEIAAALLHTPSGRTVRATARRMDATAIIITFSDITDLIRAEEEQKELTNKLNHSQRMQSIGELTGGVAHDFNNLLAIIAGNAELLSLSVNNSNRHLQAISEAAHSGAELTQSLLALSSKQTLKPAPINMNSLVKNVCKMLDRTLGDTIIVKTIMPDDPWTCMADRGKLENALINLAVNARDSMPKGGPLQIQVSNIALDDVFLSANNDAVAGDYVCVTVSDTGAGMPKNILNKAIDPYFTTKRVGEGSGLGLSMVFGFVKQSSGHMDITSTVEHGTKVSIYLPRSHREGKSHGAIKPTIKSSPKSEGTRIMLVEDDPKVQQMLVSGLTQLGYEIVSVGSARQALETIKSKSDLIDLVISDVMLPDGVNGFELGQAIHMEYAKLPIIYMSGYAQGAMSETYGIGGDIDLLQKPFRLDELATRIENSLEPAINQ